MKEGVLLWLYQYTIVADFFIVGIHKKEVSRRHEGSTGDCMRETEGLPSQGTY